MINRYTNHCIVTVDKVENQGDFRCCDCGNIKEFFVGDGDVKLRVLVHDDFKDDAVAFFKDPKYQENINKDQFHYLSPDARDRRSKEFKEALEKRKKEKEEENKKRIKLFNLYLDELETVVNKTLKVAEKVEPQNEIQDLKKLKEHVETVVKNRKRKRDPDADEEEEENKPNKIAKEN